MDKSGGPAFACAAENGHQPGMSLRQWYAGRALTGLLVSDYGNPVEADDVTKLNTARVAFAYADAMIKAGAE